MTDADNRHLGYLIAEPHDGVVLIHTFTFLTASNAPEARKLRQLLREGGYDNHRLRLGELGTYLLGEIPRDSKLRAIFVEAGCARLLELDRKPATKTTGPADLKSAAELFDFRTGDNIRHSMCYLARGQGQQRAGRQSTGEFRLWMAPRTATL